MYESHETTYGVKFIFQGFVQLEELRRSSQETGQLMKRLQKGFGVLLDTRGMYTLPPEARELMKRNIERAKRAGMGRLAQIVDDSVTAMQFNRLARETGISGTSRQIDASSVPDCERVALDWIVEGIEPDTK